MTPPHAPTRFADHDYASACWYLVTIVTHERQPLFGKLESDQVQLSQPGELLVRELACLSTNFPGWDLDCSVVLPDHLHFIASFDGSSALGLSRLMQGLKSRYSVGFGRGVRDLGWRPYREHLWMRGFWDKAIRSERHLLIARRYVEENPVRHWQKQEDYL